MFPEYSGVCFLDEEKKKYLYKVQYVHKTLTVCDVYFTCRKIMLVPSPWRTSTSQLPLGNIDQWPLALSLVEEIV